MTNFGANGCRKLKFGGLVGIPAPASRMQGGCFDSLASCALAW
jgi:hypothetical protein